MPLALTHRFSVEDYFRMAESGVFAPGAKVELIGGEIVDMLPIGPFHSGSVNYLAEIFAERSRGRWQVAVQSPLALGPHDMPEPDLMLLRRSGDRYKSRHPEPGDVYLVIEVSDSSLAYDQHTKLPIYAKAGIPECWILNVPQRQLEIYREPAFSGYRSKAVHRDGGVAPALFGDASVPVADLLA